MTDLARLRLRYALRGAAFAFAFPFVFILVLAPSGVGFVQALFAGVFNAVTAGPIMTLLFVYMVPATRRIPFVPAILAQTFSFLGAGAILIAVNVALVISVFDRLPFFGARTWAATWNVLSSGEMVWAFAIGVALFFGMAMAQQVSRKLGPGVAVSWITGKYHRPREEKRVFMFLDLKDSTPLAERLGSLEFSALVQDFFNDLGLPLFATKASVSHYIGDEAVIVWPLDKAFRDSNCVRVFFRMEEEVAKRADYYERRYGVVPSFKAGVHLGEVVSAEVGRAKSEIVYHGDAVNTTARIVGMCAALGHDLIVSKDVADRLQGSRYRIHDLGSHALKGKAEPVRLFAVEGP